MLQKYIRIINNSFYVYKYFTNIKYQHWSYFLNSKQVKINYIRILQIKVIKIILEVIIVVSQFC